MYVHQPRYTDCVNCGGADHSDYPCPCACHHQQKSARVAAEVSREEWLSSLQDGDVVGVYAGPAPSSAEKFLGRAAVMRASIDPSRDLPIRLRYEPVTRDAIAQARAANMPGSGTLHIAPLPDDGRPTGPIAEAAREGAERLANAGIFEPGTLDVATQWEIGERDHADLRDLPDDELQAGLRVFDAELKRVLGEIRR